MATVELIPTGEVEFTDVKSEGNKLSGTPVFYGTGRENANIVLALVKNAKGEVVRRCILRISGADYKISVQERSNPVEAAAEKKAKSKPKPPPLTEGGKGAPTPV